MRNRLLVLPITAGLLIVATAATAAVQVSFDATRWQVIIAGWAMIRPGSLLRRPVQRR